MPCSAVKAKKEAWLRCHSSGTHWALVRWGCFLSFIFFVSACIFKLIKLFITNHTFPLLPYQFSLPAHWRGSKWTCGIQVLSGIKPQSPTLAPRWWRILSESVRQRRRQHQKGRSACSTAAIRTRGGRKKIINKFSHFYASYSPPHPTRGSEWEAEGHTCLRRLNHINFHFRIEIKM